MPNEQSSEPRPESPAERARSTLVGTLELLWNGHTPAGKGPRPGLTLEQIVSTAIELADAEGVDALSMRGVARALGVGTMTLYRYVADKSVLLNLMLDQVSAPSTEAVAARGRTWREVLEASAWDSRALYLRHPWLLQVNWSRPALGPNSIAGLELVIAGLAKTPMADREKIMIVTELDAYVVGSVRLEVWYEEAGRGAALDDATFWAIQYPALERAMASGDYPAMAAMSEDSFGGGWEETFALGLKHLLDGIGRDIESRAG